MRILKFSAVWCASCKLISKNLEMLDDITIEEIDVDDRPDLAKLYKIKALPTIIVTKEGKEVSRLTGSPKIETLRNMLAKARHISADMQDETHLHGAFSSCWRLNGC